jgi:hypothetical protein
MESMEMDPGALPHPGRVPNRDFCPPNLIGGDGGAAGLLLENCRTI